MANSELDLKGHLVAAFDNMKNVKRIIIVFVISLLGITAKAQQKLRQLDDGLDKQLSAILQKNTDKLKGQNAVYMFAIRFSLSRKNGKVSVDSISSSSPEEASLLFTNVKTLKTTDFEKLISTDKKVMFVKPVIVYVIGKQSEDKTYTMAEVLKKGMSLLDDKHNGKKYQPEDLIYEKITLQPFLMLFDLNEYN